MTWQSPESALAQALAWLVARAVEAAAVLAPQPLIAGTVSPDGQTKGSPSKQVSQVLKASSSHCPELLLHFSHPPQLLSEQWHGPSIEVQRPDELQALHSVHSSVEQVPP